MTTVIEADVVVVGAGLSGLAAAQHLDAAGVRVVVLEANERVGGRVLTVDVEGVPIDLGAQWTGHGQDALGGLAAELGIDTVSTHADGEMVEWERGQRREEVDEDAWVAAWSACEDANELARGLSPEMPWAGPNAAALDRRHIGDWLSEVGHSGARWRLETALRGVWAAELHETSLLHLAVYSAADDGLQYLLGIDGGAQELRFARGAQAIAQALAEQLGERVRLGDPVRAITHNARQVTATTASGLRVAALRTIVALAPALVGRIAFDPPLPADREGLQQRLPLATGFKVAVLYDEPFWRAEGLSGMALADEGVIRFCADSSPPGGPGVLVALVDGDDGRRLARIPTSERRAALLADLSRFFGPKIARPVAVLDHDWGGEPHIRGSVTTFPVGVWTSYGMALRAPVGPVHWAGTETAIRMLGQMDGAVRAGRHAAETVLTALGHDVLPGLREPGQPPRM